MPAPPPSDKNVPDEKSLEEVLAEEEAKLIQRAKDAEETTLHWHFESKYSREKVTGSPPLYYDYYER
jgi:hypothetical protein